MPELGPGSPTIGGHAAGGFSACSAEAWEFAELPAFWERFRPLTPRGKDRRELRLVHAEPDAIEASLDRTDAWLAFEQRQGGAGPVLDRVAWHLGRVPRLPEEFSPSAAGPFLKGSATGGSGRAADGDAGGIGGPGGNASRMANDGRSLDIVEVFQLKKFLANQRAVASLLDAEARESFGIRPACSELAGELDKGGSDAESFYLADCYSPGLAKTRLALRAIDERRAELAASARDRLKRDCGLDFGGREFLLLPHEEARRLRASEGTVQSRLAIEPYDASLWSLRLLPGEEELSLEEERARLLDEEALEGGRILAELSALALSRAAEIAEAVEALGELDLARARASLARECSMTRPRLASDPRGAPLLLREGRHIPREAACVRLGLAYQPLELSLEEGACVLFGSNMGGKTVALKTVLFMQILAQAGFHVPALSFTSAVHPRIHYVGDLGRGARAGDERFSPAHDGGGLGGASPDGLSGFGFEIRAFAVAWENAALGGFAVFDEFARTTASHEAESILTAVLEGLGSRPGSRSLFSTHFRGVARLPGVRYLRMKGLDREAARLSVQGGTSPLADRIRRINSLMEYKIIDEGAGAPAESDAILIAGLLGMDEGIIARAMARHAASAGIGEASEASPARPGNENPGGRGRS
jgi:hypothetical protein